MSPQPSEQTEQRAQKTHMGLKIFSYVVLGLMAVSIVFTVYIVSVNWSHIGV